MTATRRLLASALALSLPLAAIAQTAPAADPAAAPAAAPAPVAAPAAAPAPAADGVKFTPYGFILANAFFTGNSLTDQDYPGTAVAAAMGGSVLFSARQSRIGFRVSTKEDLTGSDLSGVLEFDFSGGHAPGNPTCTYSAGPPIAIACTQGAASSTAWYNALVRLRIASMTAAWKTDAGTFSVLASQDVGIVNVLFAESLAWVAKPLFWQSGNLWRRSPQFRATWAGTFGDFGVSAAVAALSPATTEAGTSVPTTTPNPDFGAGNQSRMPNIEGRLAGTAKFPMDVTVAVGLGYHQNTRRLAYHTANQLDVDGSLIGVDVDLGLTKYAQVKGEYYTGKGADDTYNAIGNSTYGTGLAIKPLESSGYWAQLIAKPLPWAWITVGLGHAEVDKDNSPLTTSTGAARVQQNNQLAGGVIINAGKAWRFGVEYVQLSTEYFAATRGAPNVKQEATQIGVSSQLKF